MTDDNLRRIARASVALKAYTDREVRNFVSLREDDLVDLLTDLRHWAHTAGVDFDQNLATSARHFEAEIKE